MRQKNIFKYKIFPLVKVDIYIEFISDFAHGRNYFYTISSDKNSSEKWEKL